LAEVLLSEYEELTERTQRKTRCNLYKRLMYHPDYRRIWNRSVNLLTICGGPGSPMLDGSFGIWILNSGTERTTIQSGCCSSRAKPVWSNSQPMTTTFAKCRPCTKSSRLTW